MLTSVPAGTPPPVSLAVPVTEIAWPLGTGTPAAGCVKAAVAAVVSLGALARVRPDCRVGAGRREVGEQVHRRLLDPGVGRHGGA